MSGQTGIRMVTVIGSSLGPSQYGWNRNPLSRRLEPGSTPGISPNTGSRSERVGNRRSSGWTGPWTTLYPVKYGGLHPDYLNQGV